MKIIITNKYQSWQNVSTGKGFFVIRLIKELRKLGHIITTDPAAKADIALGIGKFTHEFPNCKKKILRLGDIHKEKDRKQLNKPKRKSLKGADGVIFQSEYSKRLCYNFIGKPKCRSTVIFNGAAQDLFNTVMPSSPYQYNYLASAREWTIQKRLPDILSAFSKARVSDKHLYICGKIQPTPLVRSCNAKVSYIGVARQETLRYLYKLCNALIDITWLSACPNSVVEALVAGCPVISGNDGGIIELGTADQVALDSYTCIAECKPWGMKKPVNLNKPPKFPVDLLAKAIEKYSYPYQGGFTYKSLHIENIAKQYVEFFQEILDG